MRLGSGFRLIALATFCAAGVAGCGGGGGGGAGGGPSVATRAAAAKPAVVIGAWDAVVSRGRAPADVARRFLREHRLL